MDDKQHGLRELLHEVARTLIAAALALLGLVGLFDLPPLLVIGDALTIGFVYAAWRHRAPQAWLRWTVRSIAIVALLVLGAVTLAYEPAEAPSPRANVPPVAIATASETAGTVPLRVVFDATQSSDPDSHGPLAFEWDLDGDGGFDDATDDQPVQTYDAPGRYLARVRVSIDDESSISKPIEITATEPKREPRPRRVERLDYVNAPGTQTALGLTVVVGETDTIGSALEEALTRLVVRTTDDSCSWKNVLTGDRFLIAADRQRYQIDIGPIGQYDSDYSAYVDAKVTVRKRASGPDVRHIRCTKDK